MEEDFKNKLFQKVYHEQNPTLSHGDTILFLRRSQ